MCGLEEHLLVATSLSQIEVFSLVEPGCPLITRFPTVAPVVQMLYSKKDEFLATLEESSDRYDTENRSVRIYRNWHANRDGQPMRARVAGHSTSIRYDEDLEDRFEVIEIPLKGDPTTLAIDGHTGILGVAIGKTLLVYGMCNKIVAEGNGHKYYDIKLLLELEFSFDIHSLALCEEYIACASYHQFQVVKVNNRRDMEQLGKLHKSATDTNLANLTQLKSGIIGALQRHSTSDSGIERSNEESNFGEVVDDKNLTKIDFDQLDEEAYSAHQKAQSAKGTAAKEKDKYPKALGKTILTRSTKHLLKKPKKKKLFNKDGEIFGPVENFSRCQVTVEFEDVCDVTEGEREGYLEYGVTTCVYREFDLDVSSLHSVRLFPVYSTEVNTKTTVPDSCKCCSEDRHTMLGISCFVSTLTNGYLYSVHCHPRRIATYPYTTPSHQVCVNGDAVYSVSENMLEVYTSRSLTPALHKKAAEGSEPWALPPEQLEPCLINMQPFVSINSIAVAPKKLIILSKHITQSSSASSPETNWSIYALQTPSAIVLHRDMLELAQEHKMTPVYEHLLQESLLLTYSKVLLTRKDKDLEPVMVLVKQSAALLAQYYASGTREMQELVMPYYVLSGLKVMDALRHIGQGERQAIKDGGKVSSIPDSVIYLLDYMLDAKREKTLTGEDLDKVLEIYSEAAPAKLSTILFKSQIKDMEYSYEKAFGFLNKWVEQSGKPSSSRLHKLDLLGLAALHLSLCEPGEAEAVLFSLSRDDLVSACVENSELLHQGTHQLTPLAQLLRRHQPGLFLQVMLGLVDTERFTLSETLQFLEQVKTTVIHF